MLPNLSVIATMRVSRIDAESYFAFWLFASLEIIIVTIKLLTLNTCEASVIACSYSVQDIFFIN